MLAEINITDGDIVYPERVLLSRGQEFDDERRIFIKNLQTIDLQAVPGSGKTTALLAKLLILEKHFPFDNGSGILVISHTNAAIDEIKSRIAKYCPKLFSYPNFVGTIQSFVDEFLAIPYYLNHFKKKPYRIDDEIYYERIESYYNRMPYSGAKSWLDRKNDPLSFLKNLRFDIELNLTDGINGKTSLKSENNSTTFKLFKKMKCKLLEWGYLHFDDAYFLANLYLKEFSQINKLLQKRFRYVFVDEMQDMDKHQYDLLEKVFFDGGSSISKYQRIGDKNQAIFNGSAKLDDIWKARTILKLKGSYRLTKEVANIVKHFGLEFVDIDGRFINSSGSNLIPYLIVFDNPENVLPKFTELIKENKLGDEKYPFCAIGWRADYIYLDKEKINPDKSKLTVKCYLPNFEKEEHRPKEDYFYLESYLLHYDKDKKTLESVRKCILNALLKILRYENILDDNGRNYTKKKLLSFLKENNEEQYEKLKLLLYQWSINIIRGKKDDVYFGLKNFISNFLSIFGKSIDKSRDFIETSAKKEQVTVSTVFSVPTNGNTYEKDGIKVEVSTIHAVKGQTHTATLYLETFYRGKYESDRLGEQFKGNNFNSTGNYEKQSTKMAYVGLSRPTHLLCLAIQKDRFKENDFKDRWEIIDITETASTVLAPTVKDG